MKVWVNTCNQMYGQLQDQLELMLDTIARETNDFKQLEQQLNEGRVNTCNQMYVQLQDQLELMLDTIVRETNDIKQLKHQLNEWVNTPV